MRNPSSTLFVALLASALACHGDHTATVRVDLGALHRHALATALPLSSIVVKASAAHFKDPVVLELGADADSFTLELPAGPKVRVEVVANHRPDTEELAAYWGEVTTDLQPGTTVELVIPVYPAGSLHAGVETSDGTPLPVELMVNFTAEQPHPELPTVFSVPVVDATVHVVLPVGFYMVAASFAHGGQTYASSPDTYAEIFHGELFDPGEPLLLAPQGGCVGESDSDGDTRCDSFDRCPDSFVDDADLDGVCGDVDNCPTTPNTNQAFNVCVGDLDNDGVADNTDNCPFDANPAQTDGDLDGVGVPCDCDDSASSCTDDCLDRDTDGTADCKDSCLNTGVDEGMYSDMLLVGHSGTATVGLCRTDGSTPCATASMCNTPSVRPDFDGDLRYDDYEDDCIDLDRDFAGIELPSARFDQSMMGVTGLAISEVALAARFDLLVAAWVDDLGNGPQVFVATNAAPFGDWVAGALPTAAFSPSVQHSAPSLAIDSLGTVHLAWVATDGSLVDVYYASSSDLAQPWSTPVNLSNAPGAEANPTITAGLSDEVVVAWEGINGTTPNIYTTRNTGGGFSTPRPVRADAVNAQHEPALAVDPTNGSVYVAWADALSGNFQIFLAASVYQGSTFGSSAVVDGSAGAVDDRAPAIAFDVTGSLHVAWERHTTPGRIYYRVGQHGARRWEPARLVFDGESPGQDQLAPRLATAWLGGKNVVTYLAYTVALAGAPFGVSWVRSVDRGASWLEPPIPLILPEPTSLATDLAVVPTAVGTEVVGAIADGPEVFFSRRGIGCPLGPDCDDDNAWCDAKCVDLDADTVCANYDCNDFDGTVSPVASEVCDLKDNNCDGRIDEGQGTNVEFWNMEGGAPGWTQQAYSGAANEWALTTASFPGIFGATTFGSTFYGNTGNNGPANETKDSALLSPTFTLPNQPVIGLTFASYTFNGAGCPTGGGEDGEELELGIGAQLYRWSDCGDPRLNLPYVGVITYPGYDLSLLRGKTDLHLRFHFNTLGTTGNGMDDGWYVDDVRLYTCP